MDPNEEERQYLLSCKHLNLDFISIGWLKFLYNNKLIDKDYLTELCMDYEVEMNDNTIDNILNLIPFNWMSKVIQWLNNNPKHDKILSNYASDTMLNILTFYNKNKNIENRYYNMFIETSNTIMLSPHPDKSFIAFRAVRNASNIHLIDTPKSASLMLHHIDKYIDDNSVVLKITIKENSCVSYYISEDQIIFPMNSKFKVVSQLYTRQTSIGSLQFYDVEYLL